MSPIVVFQRIMDRGDLYPKGFKSIRPFSNLHLPVVGFVGSNPSDPTNSLFHEIKLN